MLDIRTYNQDIQREIEEFYEKCLTDIGWKYDPHGRHADIMHIDEAYMRNGCMWCLYDDKKLIGTVAVRNIDKQQKVAEIKRFFVLGDYQGKGCGRLLFEKALSFCREYAFSKVCLDTRNDRYASIHIIKDFGFAEIEKYNNNEFAELFFELKL